MLGDRLRGNDIKRGVVAIGDNAEQKAKDMATTPDDVIEVDPAADHDEEAGRLIEIILKGKRGSHQSPLYGRVRTCIGHDQERKWRNTMVQMIKHNAHTTCVVTLINKNGGAQCLNNWYSTILS